MPRSPRIPSRPPAKPSKQVAGLSDKQLEAISLSHNINLDAIQGGTANEALLWDWFFCALTWSRAAQLAELGEPEMTQQLGLVSNVMERYGKTGRIEFVGDEYEIARRGVMVMDSMAEQVSDTIARKAALWSEQQRREFKRLHAIKKPAARAAKPLSSPAQR